MAANADDSYNSLDEIRAALPRNPVANNNQKSSASSQNSQSLSSTDDPDSYQSLQQIRDALSGAPNAANDAQSSMWNQISRVPGIALNAAENLPGQLMDLAGQVPGAAQKVLFHPNQAGMDILGGAARGVQNTLGAMGEAGQGIASALTGGYAPRVDIRQQLGLDEKHPNDWGKLFQSKDPDPLLSGLGQYGMGGAAGGSKLLPMIAANAANAAIQAPPGQRLEAGVTGAVDVGLPMVAGKGAGIAGNALRPSNLFRGTLSPEDLQANLEAAQGTNTGLGNIIGSPTLKGLQENVLTHIPFSGAYTAMQKTANQLTQKGEDLIGKIGEGLPEGDQTKALQGALKDSSKQATRDKNADYSEPNTIADEMGMVVGRKNLQAKAQETLDNLNKSPELMRGFPKDLLDDIQSYADNEKGNSLKLSNIFRGTLGEKANSLYEAGNTHQSGIVSSLKDALGDDIKSAIKESGNPKLQESYDKAQSNYQTKYSTFEHPDIVKFTRKGGDADLMLSHFIRGGSNDRAELLERLMQKLPENLKTLPLNMYLSKAIDENGKLNPPKLSTLYGALGEKQRAALVPDATMRKQLNNYTRAVNMNQGTFKTMFNPHTGQRNLDTLVGGAEIAIGHMLAGGPGMAAALPAGALLGQVTGKALTHEGLRNSLVNKMIKQKK